ncbi:MAG TPA: LysE family translocator [Mycobacteriales bacterium]
MATSAILAFWGLAVLLIVVPGPDWAFTLGATLGGRRVLAAVGGLAAGYAALTAVVAAGIGALVAGSSAALTTLTLAGGGYLAWQGLTFLRRPPQHAGGMARTAATSRQTVLRGVGVSGLNPKALLLFLALLPQFTAPERGWPLPVQLAALGCLFTLTCAAFHTLLGTVARTVLAAHPPAARSIGRLSGTAMVALGLFLVTERLTGR